jgi:hypothetical protein
MSLRDGLGIAGLVAALTLAACSMGNGLWRKGAVAQIDEACAEAAIRAADGIEVVTAQDNEQKSWDLGGKKTVLTNRSVVYRHPDGQQGAFSMTRSNQETSVVIQHVSGKPPGPGEEISADEAQSAVKTMLRIERAIENSCKVEFALSTTCWTGIDCKALEAIVAEDEA